MWARRNVKVPLQSTLLMRSLQQSVHVLQFLGNIQKVAAIFHIIHLKYLTSCSLFTFSTFNIQLKRDHSCPPRIWCRIKLTTDIFCFGCGRKCFFSTISIWNIDCNIHFSHYPFKTSDILFITHIFHIYHQIQSYSFLFSTYLIWNKVVNWHFLFRNWKQIFFQHNMHLECRL